VSHRPVRLHEPLMSHLNFQMSQWKQLPVKKKKKNKEEKKWENPAENFPVSQRTVSLYFLEKFLECAFQVIDRPMSDKYG